MSLKRFLALGLLSLISTTGWASLPAYLDPIDSTLPVVLGDQSQGQPGFVFADVKALPDGKILVLERKYIRDNVSWETHYRTRVYLSDGTIVSTGSAFPYNTTGSTVYVRNPQAPDVRTFCDFRGFDNNNKIILSCYDDDVVSSGSSNQTIPPPRLQRYNIDGTLDASFQTKKVRSIGFQNDGKMVISGILAQPGPDSLWIEKINPDGTLDSSFGVNGSLEIAKSPSLDSWKTVIQADGKILIQISLGTSTLIRLTPAGRPDTAFGSNGQQTVTVDTYNGGLALTNDKIVMAGRLEGLPIWKTYGLKCYRLDTGSQTSCFSSNLPDPLFTFKSGANGQLHSIMPHHFKVRVLPQNSILVGTTSSSGDLWALSDTSFYFALYQSDGTLNPSFGVDGIITDNMSAYYPENEARLYGMDLDLNGKILAVGGLKETIAMVFPPGDWDPEARIASLLARIKVPSSTLVPSPTQPSTKPPKLGDIIKPLKRGDIIRPSKLTPLACSDPDGFNPNVKSTVTVTSGPFTKPKSYTDTCVPSGGVLTEYLCDAKGNVTYFNKKCSCQNGACSP